MNLWILLTFLSLAQTTHSCPELCSCLPPPSGSEVVCSHGSLTHFPAKGLSPITTELFIHSANLSNLTASDLSAAPLLNKLQVYHSNLTNLPSDLLRDVRHLNTLDLTGNRLLRLPQSIFSHVSLHSLVLKNNMIESADAEWFDHNSSLTWLDLSGNRLTHVPAALLHKLPNLETLDLSDNQLQELQADALTQLHRLESLNLAGNKLSSLEPTIFTHNLRLSQLFLQQNELRELPASLLQGLQNLQLLLLNQNQLQRLPSGLLEDRKSSFQISLSGNPWVCDTGMDYLWRWLTANPHNVLFSNDVTCANPEALKHKELTSLTRNDLGLN